MVSRHPLNCCDPKADRTATLLLYDKDLRSLPVISHSEHYSWWTALTSGNNGGEILNREERLFLSKREDFISTRIERSNYPLDWLIYGRLGPWLTVSLRYITVHYTRG